MWRRLRLRKLLRAFRLAAGLLRLRLLPPRRRNLLLNLPYLTRA